MQPGFRIAAIGELLWDLLPSGPLLGGAPANFAVMSANVAATCSQMPAAQVFLISCVGDDPLGRRALDQLGERSVILEDVSVDKHHPTGTVLVELNANAIASYRISENAAWDHILQTPLLSRLAPTLDAVCFGTLAQRSPATRTTLRKVVESTAPRCLRVFDVNLRAPYWTPEALAWGCAHATILKMNLEEVPLLVQALAVPPPNLSPTDAARFLLLKYDIEVIAITRGARGSLLVTREAEHDHPGVAAKVVDTIGAGDAFTAALTYSVLRGSPLPQIAETANRWGAWATGRHGGMPAMRSADRQELRSTVETVSGVQIGVENQAAFLRK